MIPSNYDANIAQHGRHWGRVEFGQASEAEAVRKAQELVQRFPASEGFEVTLSYAECIGRRVSLIPGR